MEITPEIMALAIARRKEYEAEVAKVWRMGLTHKDWLLDGHSIRGRVMLARFNNLDWDNAWMDLGPSITGNRGPYWHVPLRETIIDGQVYDLGDTVHRLYPRVLLSKWGMLMLHACFEAQRKTQALASDEPQA